MKTIFWTFQSAAVTLKIRSRSPKFNQLFPLPNKVSMQVCQFGQNPSTCSDDNAHKLYFGHFGPNPSNISEDIAQKPYFGHFKVPL